MLTEDEDLGIGPKIVGAVIGVAPLLCGIALLVGMVVMGANWLFLDRYPTDWWRNPEPGVLELDGYRIRYYEDGTGGVVTGPGSYRHTCVTMYHCKSLVYRTRRDRRDAGY